MKQLINLTLLVFCAVFVSAQETVLKKEEAVRLALEQNFGIRMAQNSVAVAENNASLLNSGFLPSLAGNAGSSYNKSDQVATMQDGTTRNVDGAETTRYNASLDMNYTLFDGLGRWYDYKRLKEQHNLSELQARETIEGTLVQMFSVYYEVARISENISVLKETYNNTQKRLQRAQYAFEFGQNNKLDVLNAEVDLANDSIALLNARQSFKNTVRDLNVVLNQSLETQFLVDTTLTFSDPVTLEGFLDEVEANNVLLQQAKSNAVITDYTLKSARSVFLPTVGLTGSYGWNEGNFPSTNFLASSNSTGVTAGVNLSWSLFDGGRGITQVRNAKIQLENQELVKKQLEQEVHRDISNAWGEYQNRLLVYELQEKNVVTATDNYDRSNERYNLGQITSVELRQAQINLLNAQTNKNQAKYTAKLAELLYLQQVGQLLNVEL